MTFIERIVNADNQTIIDKPYTAEQIAEVNAWAEQAVTQQKERAEAVAAKAAAQAKLAALGLTTDDIKALGLGGN